MVGLFKKACAVLAGATVAVLHAPVVAPASEVPITWEDCPVTVTDPRAECGQVEVPQDYADPTGATINVGFVRVPAGNPTVRRGVLFGNPGGPGGDAYSYFGSDSIAQWPKELSDEWDLVAVQPRGLQGSTPLQCDVPNPASPMEALSSVAQAVTNQGGFNRAACDQHAAGYSATITTENTARDWEQVRIALGEDRISILGLSYGTLLGSTYATLFPAQVDRLVLDSAVDPSLMWNGVMAAQKHGYEGALNDYFAWVADNHERFGMGDTPLKAYQYWSNRVVEESGTNPTIAPPPAQVGDLPPALLSSGQLGADALTSSGKLRVEGEGVVSRLLNPGANQVNSPLLINTRLLLPLPKEWETLASMTNGTFTPEEAEVSEELANLHLLNASTGMQMQAIQMCNENTVAPNVSWLPTYVWANFITGDIFDAPPAMIASGAFCNGAPALTTPVELNGSELETRPLLIQGTGDPQTPYHLHHNMADSMNAHVLTVHGPGHGHVGFGNEKVDNHVVNYLRNGHIDAAETTGFFG